MGRKKNEPENEPTPEIFKALKDLKVDNNDNQDIVIAPEISSIPKISSVDWTSFVLGKLNPDELYNGCPTYEGLRRVCYDLLGTITNIDINVVQAPNIQNGNHSCIIAKITIEHPTNFTWLEDVAGRTITYSQAGDIFHGNGNNDQFAWRFSSATCWTRTKASLLRDTFRLKFVYSREELSDLDEGDSGANGYINPNQIDCLDMICKRINVDAAKFIRGIWKKLRPNDNTDDLNLVPFSTTVQCIALLNSWQQDKNKIKAETVGYNKDWKSSFKNI